MKFKWCEWTDEGVRPIWYHGHTHWDYLTMRRRTWVLGLHLLVRWAVNAKYVFDRYRYGKSWRDEQVWAAVGRQIDWIERHAHCPKCRQRSFPE